MKRAIFACVLLLASCTPALQAASDSLDVSRGVLKSECTVESVKCEVARALVNDAIAAYNAALAAPDDDKLEAAALAAVDAAIAAVSALHGSVK